MKLQQASVMREIAHWRHFFRTRDSALARSEGQTPRGRRRLPWAAQEPDPTYAPTEWAETEWPDTCIDDPSS